MLVVYLHELSFIHPTYQKKETCRAKGRNKEMDKGRGRVSAETGQLRERERERERGRERGREGEREGGRVGGGRGRGRQSTQGKMQR